MQYFINNTRFYKIIGRKFYHTEIKPQGEAKNEKDDCWCLSRQDEDKIVLDQLTMCLNRVGNTSKGTKTNSINIPTPKKP